MLHTTKPPTLADTRTTLDELGPRFLRLGLIVGIVGIAASVLLGLNQGDGLRRLSFSYLTNYAYFLSISLSALFFVALQFITRSSWSVVIRRLAEIAAANLLLLAVLVIPIILAAPKIYTWAAADSHVYAELLAHKQGFLNVPFFAIRWVIYFVIWCGLAFMYRRNSLGQDRTGDPQTTIRLESRSGPALVLFALSVTLASFDLLMSLDPSWYSTMFGVYFFSGGLVCFFALMTLSTLGLNKSGRLTRIVTIEHFHDYGKLMFAFIFFWAYIAFSQYMLIWYANIPEETQWLLRRQQEGWGWLGLVLLFGHFLIPFLGLMSRYTKRRRASLTVFAVWITIMHWADMFWVVMPEFNNISGATGVPLHLVDLTCFLGLGGLYVAGIAWFAGKHSLVPTQDPRLDESIIFENA